MKKIDEQEENEMYYILSQAIYSLCENKPQNAIEHLAKKLLEYSGEHPDLIRRFSKKQKVRLLLRLIYLRKYNWLSKKSLLLLLTQNLGRYYITGDSMKNTNLRTRSD